MKIEDKAIEHLCNFVVMKEKLPETYNSLFNFVPFDKVEEKIILKKDDEYTIGNLPIVNPYHNIEIMIMLPKEIKKRFLICACSIN